MTNDTLPAGLTAPTDSTQTAAAGVPSPAAAPAPAPARAPAPVSPPLRLDRDNRPHDPQRHVSPPEKDKNGRWKKKTGRPRKHFPGPPRGTADFSDVAKVLATPPPAPVAAPAPAVAPETPPAEPSGGVIAPELLADKYTQAGVAVVCGISTGAILFMGAHAAPKGDESAAMVKAYADCFRHYGYAPEPPAWLGPVIATGVWLGPQLQDERTQTNLQKWKARLIGWWLALRGKFAARAATNAAVEIAAAGTGTPPPSP